MAKKPDYKQGGACNQGKEKLIFIASVRRHSACSVDGSNYRFWKKWV